MYRKHVAYMESLTRPADIDSLNRKGLSLERRNVLPHEVDEGQVPGAMHL